MAGRRVALTQEQSVAMEEVRMAAAGLATVEQIAKKRAEELKAQIKADAIKITDAAIRKASDAGVSMQRIADEAMGYHNPFWVRESLKRTGGTAYTMGSIQTVTFSRVPNTEHIRVKLVGYPTTSKAADYPDVLTGIVTPNFGKPNGWAIVEDDTVTVPGLPGHLEWELDRRRTPGDRHLADDLTAWDGAN